MSGCLLTTETRSRTCSPRSMRSRASRVRTCCAVVAAAAYDPEVDLPHSPDSVFCSHGAGFTVKWRDVAERAHTEVDAARLRPHRPADAAFFSAGC